MKKQTRANKLYEFVDIVTLKEASDILFTDNTQTKLTDLGEKYLLVLEQKIRVQNKEFEYDSKQDEEDDKKLADYYENIIAEHISKKVNSFLDSIKLNKLNKQEDIK